MRTNQLGRTAVEITELGFGGGPLGGLFEPLDDTTAARALTEASDSGIRNFDTSPHYGIGHHLKPGPPARWPGDAYLFARRFLELLEGNR
ncbi:aldo/keto reductase [Streptomyces albicerus]|uniref:aldo/keto reductase n=1 Tax=Streptomyces albicerus TaxID=2569859 RepID=UPI00124B7AAF|nr:aldo/keto reductase [Streptomyces albicerus]